MPRARWGEMFGDPAGLLGAQGDGAADRAQPAAGVVAAQDEELRAGQRS
ncbi:hypothetical protein [Streptomyces globosus]|nr:hypothetical protein [Streptomyces globosus]